jgi:hypothetical protein
MKFNWGTKLVLFALLFMTFIVTLVVKIMREDVPMVETDYYEKGLNYQQEIDNSTRTDSMVQFNVFNDDSGYQHLVILNVSSADIPDGKLIFYRPSNEAEDAQADVSIPSKKVFQFPLHTLTPGKWTLKFTWTRDGQKYKIEKPITR